MRPKHIRLLVAALVILSILATTLGCSSGAATPAATQPAASASTSAPAAASTSPAAAPAASSSSSAAAPAASGKPAPEFIVLGVNNPVTGMFAGFGQGGTFGSQAAVDDINKAGGIMVKEYGKKIPVKLLIRDNESDPKKSATLTEQLILNDKINFLVSPNQPLTLIISEANLCDQYKIPRVTGGNPGEGWLELRKQAAKPYEYSWTYGFMIAGPSTKGSQYDAQGWTVKDTWAAMLEQYGGQTNKTVGVFASDEPDGAAWYSLFPGILKDMGYNVVGIDKKVGLAPMDTTDFTSIINEWKKANIDILWGNAPAPFFGTMWRQARSMGLKPKMLSIGRAPLFYTDVAAWGGDLPNGIGVEIWWDQTLDPKECPGIGDTTPKSLADRWKAKMNQPVNPAISSGYGPVQILADAIERAGTLDSAKVNAALAQTNMKTLAGPIKFDDNHHAQMMLAYGQWQSVDTADKYDCKVVYSKHSFLPTNGKYIFPIPYK